VSSGTLQPGLYLGLMSGTSMDGIDAALVEFGTESCRVLAAQTFRYADELREALSVASKSPDHCAIDEIGRLDHWVAESFRDAALDLLKASATSADDVIAIGSHGQTLRHRPRADRPYTLQLGDPNIIAAGTGITTVADFRRCDLALGGEGAPLAPGFHQWAFSSGSPLVIANIGGFANITVLGDDDVAVTGFDTGPGNTLMDGWCMRHRGEPYDENGNWAASGSSHDILLRDMLTDPYFALEPPKSTGFEYFHAAWLDHQLSQHAGLEPADVQATLCELSARSIANAIKRHAPAAATVYACGGGVHNAELIGRLQANLPGVEVASTASRGIDPDWIEAAAFAWLAARRLAGLPGNLPAVTGASRPGVLGGIYSGRS
jgi:anhydro-N-acetylmuramic acid kinase